MARLERMIDQGTGRAPADIVLKGGRFLDLVTGDLVESDIAICEDRIVGTCGTYSGTTEIDISGSIVVPGSGHFWASEPVEEPGSYGAQAAPQMLRFLQGAL